MGNHIGKHIIEDQISSTPKTCGFCGLFGCSIELVTPCKGKAAVTTPYSDCKYFVKFSIGAAKKSSSLSPCTNVPMACPACKNTFWSYNIECHYRLDHPALDVPKLVGDLEIKKLKSLII